MASVSAQRPSMKLYHCPETRSMRTLWLLHELQIPFELIEMPFDIAVLQSDAYRSVHPLGRVPALTDGDLTLTESGAITQYLCERYADRGLGRPPGHPERYAWLQWIHFSETLVVHAGALVQQLHFIPAPQRSETVLKIESRRLRKAIGALSAALDGREYLLAGGFSAADVSVGYSLHLGSRFVRLEAMPEVAAYYRRLSARPAFGAALPAGWRRPIGWLTEEFEPI